MDYEAEFQRNVDNRFKTWVPPPPKAKKHRGETAKKPMKGRQAGEKRKRHEVSESGSGSEGLYEPLTDPDMADSDYSY